MNDSTSLTRKGTSTKYFSKYCTVCCVPFKGALLVLLWSTLLHCLDVYLLILGTIEYHVISNNKSLRIIFIVFLSAKFVTLLLYPVAGLLAETLLTRYKVMMIGTIIAVIGLAIASLSAIVGTIVVIDHYGNNISIITIGVLIPVVPGFIIYHFGLGLFEANAIQFGTDQLQFASNEELSKFVHWYFWTLYAVQSILSSLLLYSRSFLDYKDIVWIWALVSVIALVCSLLTVVINCCCCRHHLFTEPVCHTNPLKQIVKVLSFSVQHKQPVRRSAFTYGELPPSRLDLGKERYGGPFTTEQVEDVKSFGRIFLIILTLFGVLLLEDSNGQLGEIYSNYYLQKEIVSVSILEIGASFYFMYYVIIIGIPVYMCLLRPCLRHHLPNMLKKMGIGLLMIIVVFTLTTIYIALMYISYTYNKVVCFSNETLVSNLPDTFGLQGYEIFLLITSEFISGLSYLLVFLTALEFILAQAPRSMQGLLIGLWYAYQSLEVPVRLVSVLTLQDVHCHYWPYIVKTVLAIISLLLYLLVSRWYKYRQRDEPSNINRQVIIEEYTERQILNASANIDVNMTEFVARNSN